MLGHRYTLSGITATAFDGPAELAEAAPPSPDQELRDSDSMQAPVVATSVPEIRDFDAYVDLNILIMSGRVYEDGSPVGAGMTVSLSWWEGDDDATTDSMGQFYFTTQLEEPDEGYVSAVTWNDVGESETAEAFVENPQ
jgi:hypothetical protein